MLIPEVKLRHLICEALTKTDKDEIARISRREIRDLFKDEYMKKMEKEIEFKPNPSEDPLRQIPEIVLEEHCPELYWNMWFVVQNVINPMIYSLYQRDCAKIASVQIANYNPEGQQAGAWHHDDSADISVVVPLNTGGYVGGGTE